MSCISVCFQGVFFIPPLQFKHIFRVFYPMPFLGVPLHPSKSWVCEYASTIDKLVAGRSVMEERGNPQSQRVLTVMRR